jgi:flagellar biosynthesis anti-sigma factor FlgM
MRMSDHKTTPSVHDSPPVRHGAAPPPDSSAEDGATRNPGGASDTGERPSQSPDIQRARAVAQAAPEVRLAKVEAARRALQEGTLTLDGQALAEKLLQAVRTERRHA